jgi:cell division protein FtsB
VYESIEFFDLSTEAKCDSLEGMNKLYAYNSFFREHLLILIGVCMCAYFSYHAVAGNRGLVRLVLVSSKIETLSNIETSLIAQNDDLSKKVGMMRPGTVDKDLLEERVRRVLGYRSTDEFSVLSN